MNRKLIWVERPKFHGFGCSSCDWIFTSSARPVGKTFDELTQNYQTQMEKEFAAHDCAKFRTINIDLTT
jgi:hypothetical protein